MTEPHFWIRVVGRHETGALMMLEYLKSLFSFTEGGDQADSEYELIENPRFGVQVIGDGNFTVYQTNARSDPGFLLKFHGRHFELEDALREAVDRGSPGKVRK